MSQTAAVTTRDRLLRAALELIEEGGYAASSVGAIAARAGLATGALYRHFPSKADLFVEVFRDAADKDLAAMVAAAGCSADFGEQLESVIRTHATRALRHRRLAWALVHEPVDPLVDAERLACRRRYRDGMAGLLREGVQAGAIPEQNVAIAAAAVVGAIAEALVGPLSPPPGEAWPENEIVASIAGLCRRAVGLPATSPADTERSRS